jgi:hypothetical protein
VLEPVVQRVLEQVFPAEGFERVHLLVVVWVKLELAIGSIELIHCRVAVSDVGSGRWRDTGVVSCGQFV